MLLCRFCMRLVACTVFGWELLLKCAMLVKSRLHLLIELFWVWILLLIGQKCISWRDCGRGHWSSESCCILFYRLLQLSNEDFQSIPRCVVCNCSCHVFQSVYCQWWTRSVFWLWIVVWCVPKPCTHLQRMEIIRRAVLSYSWDHAIIKEVGMVVFCILFWCTLVIQSNCENALSVFGIFICGVFYGRNNSHMQWKRNSDARQC